MREPESAKISSLSPERLETLCTSYEVVVNEIHHVDLQERSLTCVWDVFVKHPSEVDPMARLFTDILTEKFGIRITRKDEKTGSSSTELPAFTCTWKGNDTPHERPPVHVQHALSALGEKLALCGFRVTADRRPQL